MCEDYIPDFNSSECSQNFIYKTYTFEDNKCFENGFYFGEVVYRDSFIVKIKCVSDNKYMNGQIISMRIIHDAESNKIINT